MSKTSASSLFVPVTDEERFRRTMAVLMVITPDSDTVKKYDAGEIIFDKFVGDTLFVRQIKPCRHINLTFSFNRST